MQLSLICSGFLRARRPMADTDLPFVLTVLTLLIIAMLPPPSIAFVGPLCQSVSLWEAAERLVRAFTFAVLYAVNVYSITSSNGIYVSETQVVVTRSAAASIWVLGSHFSWLPLAVAQCVISIHARIRYAEDGGTAKSARSSEYATLENANSTDDETEFDMESGVVARMNGGGVVPILSDPVAEQRRLLAEPQLYSPLAAPPGGAGEADDAAAADGGAEGVAETHIALTSISLQSMLASAPPPTSAPSGLRPQTPSDDATPRFGPRSFQNVGEQPLVEVAPLSSSESDWKDRAAEIAERLA
jgi:hypothetical protein